MITEPPFIHTSDNIDVRHSVAVPSTHSMSYDLNKPSPFKATQAVHESVMVSDPKPSEVYTEYTQIQSSPAKKETALTNMFLK
jgi:hypothetical protein